MLTLVLPELEAYDEAKEEFVYFKPVELKLEHSLLSISKWESIWKKPFLHNEPSAEEFLDYIRCMSINGPISDDILIRLTSDNLQTITAYMQDSMTATTINTNRPGHREIVTSELVYYWMTALNIPFTCDKWHFNRLITLIQVCSIKNGQSQDKMSPRETAARQAALNAARRKARQKGK